MKPEVEQIILAHVQFTARHFIAYRGSLDKLVELVRYSIGEAAPDADQLGLFLRKESTQKTLELEYETAIWCSADHVKSWRLICLAVKPDAEVAARRLGRRPPSSDCCSHCWQDEKGFTTQLIPELDVYGKQIAGVYLHPPCARPWKYMRDLVARAVTTKKESLL